MKHVLATAQSDLPAIAINGRFLTQILRGVQRFAIETVKSIDSLLDTPAYAALKGRVELVAPPGARDFDLRNIPLRRGGIGAGYQWEQLQFPFLTRGQLQLNLCMLGPVISPNQVVVIHDATVKALPGNFSWKFRTAYGVLVPILCRVADTVVTVSDFSRHELGKYYGAKIDRIPVCYEGCDHIVAVKPDPSIIDRLGLTGRKFFLGVGINSQNKNLDNTVAAFLQSGLDDTVLVLTGSRETRVHGQLSSADHERVRMTGFVSDAELRALYEAAAALVFASRYEGFGIPPIEAMRCGCPVIISDQPALVEVGGDAVLRRGMDDVAGLAGAMRDIHSDASLRDDLKKRGFARAERFTWDKTARQLLDLCLDAGARRSA